MLDLSIKCLDSSCDRPGHKRGLCSLHYLRLHKRVKAGETTWKQLERERSCLPGKRMSPWDVGVGGRKCSR